MRDTTDQNYGAVFTDRLAKRMAPARARAMFTRLVR